MDHVYLSVWFKSQDARQLVTNLGLVMQALPKTDSASGVLSLTVHPLDWSEPDVIDEQFSPGIPIAEAVAALTEYSHVDYALEAQMNWELFELINGTWMRHQQPVRFTALGSEFDEEAWREQGHVLVDFGSEAPFLAEGAHWGERTRTALESNLRKLLAFTNALERLPQVERRKLWSESDADLAQKILKRIQRVQ